MEVLKYNNYLIILYSAEIPIKASRPFAEIYKPKSNTNTIIKPNYEDEALTFILILNFNKHINLNQNKLFLPQTLRLPCILQSVIMFGIYPQGNISVINRQTFYFQSKGLVIIVCVATAVPVVLWKDHVRITHVNAQTATLESTAKIVSELYHWVHSHFPHQWTMHSLL